MGNAGEVGDDARAIGGQAVAERAFHRDPHDVLAVLFGAIGHRSAPVVIDADDRGAVPLHAGDQALLHRGIMFERAVAVDVVRRDIQQNADRGIQRGRQIDLVGRHLDHMDAALGGRLQRQDGGADIAAHLGVEAGLAHQMRDQRRGGRFAVGAGNRDERRVGGMPRALATEQFDVADHLDAGRLRHLHGPVRHGIRQRHAGSQDQRGEIFPRHATQIGGDEIGARGLDHAVDAVVAGDHLGAAFTQRMARSEARAAEAEYGDRLAGKGSDGDHE